MNKINVGIIGRNFGLKVIYRGLKKNNFFKVIGISFKKKSLKNDIPKNLKIYRNWRDLVSDKKIKAIIISSPPETHKEIIELAIKKNKHIFCDKPVTANYKDITHICDLLKNKKISHFVNYEFTNIDAFKIFKKKIINKIKIKKIKINWKIKKPNKKRSKWKDMHTRGGGNFYNYICHIFYYVENYFGKINLKKTFFKNNKNSFFLKTISLFKSEYINININFKIINKKSETKPLHEIIFYTNVGIYKLKTDINNLFDQFYITKNKKIIFKPRKIDYDFRLKPTLQNLLIFKNNITNSENNGSDFLIAKRIHYLVSLFSKK